MEPKKAKNNPQNIKKKQKKTTKQDVAELGHTRITSCQLGQCSDQVEPDRVGMVLVIRRNFLNVYVKYL